MTKNLIQNDPQFALASRCLDNLELVEMIKSSIESCIPDDADWGDVGDAGRTHELLVQTAFACGAISASEAKTRGVLL